MRASYIDHERVDDLGEGMSEDVLDLDREAPSGMISASIVIVRERGRAE